MPRITLDFETRSRAPLARVGATKYINDLSTAVDCMAYKVDNRPVQLWVEGEPVPREIEEGVYYGWEFHAFNANFEMGVFDMLHDRFQWPRPDLVQWRCTQAKAGHANLPLGLGDCSSMLQLPDNLGKDPEGREIMLKTCKPDNKGRWYWEQRLVREKDEAEFVKRIRQGYTKLYKYCIRDVVAEDLIDKIIPEWPDSEIEVWRVHHKINKRGITVDVDLCHAAVDIMEELKERTSERLAKMTDNQITTGNQTARILDFVNERGVNIDNMQKDTVAAALDGLDSESDEAVALEARQIVSSAAAAKYTAGADMEDNGLVRDQFIYYGASTGRWSSRGLQFHNMKRGVPDERFIDTVKTRSLDLVRAMYGSPMQELGKQCRGIICAPPGYDICDADFSQIEARMVHWLAGDMDMMEAFRTQDKSPENPDVYQAMAAKVHGISPWEVGRGDKRNSGKVLVLGAGYGMGAKRLVEYAATFGVTFTLGEAKRLIDLYRRENPLIPKLWNNYERAAISAIRGKPASAGRCKFYMDGAWLVVALPSGRKLYYFRAQYGKIYIPSKKAFETCVHYRRRGAVVPMWGGVFTENITQAVSRDLLSTSLINLDREGFDIMLHVHDQVLCLHTGGGSEGVLEDMRNVMQQNPEWCKDLPLFSDGHVCKRFRK